MTGDLVLPAHGGQETPIAWTSSAPELLSTNGRVIRPDCADRRVVLRARLERGALHRIREFPLRILRNGMAATGWSHTIRIDGKIDDTEWRFAETEVAGSSAGRLRTFVAWDATNLYLGFQGADLARTTEAAGEKWLQAYFGIPCRAESGDTNAQAFRSQSFALPFPAHYAIKWRPSDFFYNSATTVNRQWKYTINRGAPHYNPLGVGAENAAREGEMLELKIPRRAFGDPDRLQLLVFMISEQVRAEALWGIVPASAGADRTVRGSARHQFRTSFTIDFASPRPPRAQAGQ